MNKFDRYIDWCVNELMDISTIDHSKEEVRMVCGFGNISLWFVSLSMVKEDLSKLNIPTPILTILYNMGLPTDLYSMVFGKYIIKICDEIKKGLKV